MRLVACALIAALAAPACAQSGATNPGPPAREIEEVAPPTLEVAQAALEAYLADRHETYTAELLAGARVESVGPCRVDICQLAVTLRDGDAQSIRVQRNTRMPGWAIENVAIPVR